MFLRALLVFLIGVATFGGGDRESAILAENYKFNYPLGLKKMRIPRDNPLTAEKIELGKLLFFDPRLSRDNTVSCASCHDPQKGWSNGARFATGIGGQKGGRSAPTILNSGYQYFQFWDGRALHVEGQALGPIQNPIEMDLTLDELTAKLNMIDGYRGHFAKVFGTEVTTDGIAKAIGAFERTILSGNAPYDRYKAGDKQALSEAVQRGLKVFQNKGHCSACHSGHNFTDGGFHNLGVGILAENPDLGRFSETDLLGDRGAFKTPTLREIARTSPYMHDGSLALLEDVVDFYDKGGIRNPQLDEEIFPLKLSEPEKVDLVVFLKEALSSSNYPTLEPPSLPE
jgi:cytochrome c peroxidase